MADSLAMQDQSVKRARLGERVARLEEALNDYAPREADPDLFADFVRGLTPAFDLAFLQDREPATLLPLLEDLYAFVDRRAPEEILTRAADGGDAELGFVQSNMPDGPFIFDTVLLLLQSEGLDLRRQFHAILPIARDARSGGIAGIGGPGSHPESIVHVEVRRAGRTVEGLGENLRARLIRARAVVRDFKQMTALVEACRARFEAVLAHRPADQAALREGRRLLAWLLDEHFVFMGARYLPGPTPGVEPPAPFDAAGNGAAAPAGIGLLSPDLEGARPPDPLDEALAKAAAAAPFVRVRRTAEESVVHRAGKMTRVIVRWFDGTDGLAGGIVVLTGLFTFRATAAPAGTIPMLAAVLERLVRDAGAVQGSFKHRSLRNAFNSLPIEYLFMAEYTEIAAMVERVLAADAAHTTDVFIAHDQEQGYAILFVALPRANYSDDLRRELRERLAARFGASYTDSGLFLGAHDTAILYYYLTGPAGLVLPDSEELRQEILQQARPWSERLRAALEAFPTLADRPVLANELCDRYADAFPGVYRRGTSMERVLADIALLESLTTHNPVAADLFRDADDEKSGTCQLRLYELEPLALSHVLPILHNFGLEVQDQFATRVVPRGRRARDVDTFRITGVTGMPGAAADLAARKERLLAALMAVLTQRVEDGRLNPLVLRADLDWTEVDLLRAYIGYVRQLGTALSAERIQIVMTENALLVHDLCSLFRAKFDPDRDAASRAEAVEASRKGAQRHLDAIQDASAYKLLRMILNLVDASVRTNFFSREPGEQALAIKVDCALIEEMAAPRPFREVYVHHRTVSGVHIRGGPVARGGLRWSDRIDDFRTEVLGLMRTQMVKNVLIVPVGAKGGFVLRGTLPADPRERRAAADRAYERFVSALLDVTDNYAGGKVVPPERVHRYDGDDPYLVVAADKGTAHLSDTANRIALGRGFWLGDAFASGGSAGYDHKATAITARGAWVAVRRHFGEMGVDPEKDPVRVAGIGDMSGDVFGNGLLRSRTMRLVAAFDHRHVFIDPDPDPARSYAERERLFGLAGSSWGDYAAAALSKGAVVGARTAKSVALTPEARTLLGVRDEALPGHEVVRAILRLDVDLLWNGGIGTYVKAAAEDHRDAGDRANDDVRVDAEELRAKVVGEGGNLGFTQAARIAFAARGGRINTDAVDNSGGVDLSDHEVNLKLALAPLCASGVLATDARDRLLADLQGEICARVLDDNRSNTEMISLDERRSRRDLDRFDRAIRFVLGAEAAAAAALGAGAGGSGGGAGALPSPSSSSPPSSSSSSAAAAAAAVGAAVAVSGGGAGRERRGLGLPDATALKQRVAAKQGLYRPELAVLGAHTKMLVNGRLLAENQLGVDARSGGALTPYLRGYFPRSVTERFGAAVDAHPLARDIALTVVTNLVVDAAGSTFFSELVTSSGASFSEVAAAWLATGKLGPVRAVKDALGALDGAGGVPVEARYEALLGLEAALESAAGFVLAGRRRLVVAGRVEPETAATGLVTEVFHALPHAISLTATALALERRRTALAGLGLPQDLASQAALAQLLPEALHIAELCATLGQPADAVATRYFSLGERSGLLELSGRIDAAEAIGPHASAALRLIRLRLLHALGTLLVHPDLEGRLEEIRAAIVRYTGAVPTLAGLYLLDNRLSRLDTQA
jgi:glutamate dehydrogenase